MSVFHAKRPKYVLLNGDIFCNAGDFLKQRAKQNEVDVGVPETLSGTRLQRHRERTTNAFCFVGSVQSPRISEASLMHEVDRGLRCVLGL